MRQPCFWIYLLALLFSFEPCKAQPILTRSANEYTPGAIDPEWYYDSTSSVPKTIGSSATWDFSDFKFQPGPDTLRAIIPTAVPAATSFPSANVLIDRGQGLYHVYASSSAPDRLEFLGAIATNTLGF